jgi:amidohydrolase
MQAVDMRVLPTSVLDTALRVRRELHRRPELSNAEFESTALLRSELEGAGITDIRPLGPTGLVVDVHGDRPGPIVAVRSDIDALPLTELADVPFRSERPGVMHACGHDVHAAMVLGVMLAANADRSRFGGILRGFFQPAEEAEPLGARSVVAGGHLSGVDAAVALHVDPDTPTGSITLRSGPMMAGSDVFRIVVRGRSSHAGWPQLGVDAIAAAAAVVGEVQKIVARRLDPRAPVVIGIGRIAGGTANNIVADEVVLDGVLRSLHEDSRARAREILDEVVTHVCRANGATGELQLTQGEPILVNDPELVDVFRDVGTALLGPARVRELAQPTMNGEDFAFYGERVPVAMAWLGTRSEAKGFVEPLHHPGFGVDEEAIPLGISVLLEVALRLLARAGETPPIEASVENRRSRE